MNGGAEVKYDAERLCEPGRQRSNHDSRIDTDFVRTPQGGLQSLRVHPRGGVQDLGPVPAFAAALTMFRHRKEFRQDLGFIVVIRQVQRANAFVPDAALFKDGEPDRKSTRLNSS